MINVVKVLLFCVKILPEDEEQQTEVSPVSQAWFTTKEDKDTLTNKGPNTTSSPLALHFILLSASAVLLDHLYWVALVCLLNWDLLFVCLFCANLRLLFVGFHVFLVFRSQVETGHVVEGGDRHPDEQHRPLREGLSLVRRVSGRFRPRRTKT